jgi:hypothetical protein
MSFEIDPNALRDKVKSSQINVIAFIDSTLYIVFHNKATYSYEPFSKEKYEEFLNAPSIGKHFYKFIKPLKTKKL